MRRLLFVAAVLLLPTAAATHTNAGGGTRANWIDGVYEIDLGADLATLSINVTFAVHKADTGAGASASAQDLRTAYATGGGEGAPLIATVRGRIDTAFRATLDAMFPEATAKTYRPTALETSTFTATSTNAFNPPVNFTFGATFTLPESRTGFAYDADQVDAVLAAGARVAVDHTFTAQSGYRNTFHVDLPRGWVWTAFDSPASTAGSRATLTIDAVDEGAAVTLGSPARLQSRLGHPAAVRPSAVDQTATVVLEVAAFKQGTKGLPLAVEAQVLIGALDTAARFPGAIPAKVDVPYLGAEGIRRLLAADVLDDADLATAESKFATEVRDRLTSALPNTTVTSRLDRGSLSAAASGPVRFLAFANTTKEIGDIDGAVAEAVLAAGAKARLELALTGLVDTVVTYRAEFPAGKLAIDEVTGGTAPDASTLSVALDGRGTTTPPSSKVAFRVLDPRAPVLSKQDISITVDVDFFDLETSLGGLTSGDYGRLKTDARIGLALRVLEVPDEVKRTLPSNVEIEFLPSDTVRRLKELGQIDDQDIADLEKRFLDEANANLEAFAGDIPLTGGIDRASLDQVAATPPGTEPLVVDARVRFALPLAGGSPQPLAAIALTEVTKSFDLKAIEDLPTTYTITFPTGLAVSSLAAPGATATTGERDGRSSATVTVPSGTSTATITIAVTPGLLWEEFPLVVVGAGAVALLLVAAPVYAIARLVRRGKGP